MVPVKGEHGLWLAPVNGGEGGRLQARDVRLHAVGQRCHFVREQSATHITNRTAYKKQV